MKILTNRLMTIMDGNQPEKQVGFHAKYSTMDHLQAINQIIEKSQEFNQNLYVAHVDYNKAFDSVEQDSILEMRRNSIHPKYIRTVGKMYSNSRAKVRTEKEGRIFRTKRGVRRDPISPKLFTCILEGIFRKMRWHRKRYRININGRKLTNLRFADDIAIFAQTVRELQEILRELNTKSKEVGLTMNPTKTKVMTNHTNIPITIEGTKIEYCKEYPCLGQNISTAGGGEKET
jgi:hypothetical protein